MPPVRSAAELDAHRCAAHFRHHYFPPPPGQSSCRKISSGVSLILYCGELYNYFIIYHNVIIKEIKCTINVMHLNHPETTLSPPPLEKLSSTKPKLVLGAKKFGKCCSKRSLSLFSFGKRYDSLGDHFLIHRRSRHVLST